MTDEPLRFGIIGCADIAWKRGIPALLAEPRAQLAAVASRDGAKAARFAGRFGCESVEGYDALLTRDDIDAVYIPLPTGLHAEWAGAALDAGKHVLAEKPLTTSAADTAKLVEAARERKLLLTENFMFVHHPQHAEVRRLLDEGAVGEVRAFHAAFTIPRRPDGDIRYRRELGGGALLDVAGYPLRAARLLFGSDLTVAGAVLREDLGVDMGGAALLRGPGGIPIQLSFGLDDVYRCMYEVRGSEGVLHLDRAFTPPADLGPVLSIRRRDTEEKPALPPADQFALAFRHFVSTVLSGTGYEAPAADALEQASLLDAIRNAG